MPNKERECKIRSELAKKFTRNMVDKGGKGCSFQEYPPEDDWYRKIVDRAIDATYDGKIETIPGGGFISWT